MTREKDGAAVSLLNQLMRTHDLQRMLDLARPVIGNPLILSNRGHFVVAITSEPEVRDPRWEEISGTMGIPMGGHHLYRAERGLP